MRWHRARESTRFARALDPEDPQQAQRTADSVDELVSLTRRLSRIELDDRPAPAFRAETRQRMLALAEQRETPAGREPAGHRPGPRTAASRRLPAPEWGRRFAIPLAVVCVVTATLGLLTLGSRDALPGDTLYAMKRAAEHVQLGLTWDRDERGFALLHFAETRLDEVTELVQAPGALAGGAPGVSLAAGAATDEAVLTTLAEMDQQTAAGISLLTAAAVERSDKATLDILPTWAAGQQRLLGALVDQMTRTEQDRARISLALLDNVDQRARMLGLNLPCDCLEDSPTDNLGPVPCDVCQPGPGREPGGSATPSPTAPGREPSSTVTRPVPSPTRISPTA
ncbi:MAG: hypothetical protein H0V67_11045 [Geodermatophilaceae bacterium]|nr:hypothetical protein [Geodermatophilaceae bacterium]